MCYESLVVAPCGYSPHDLSARFFAAKESSPFRLIGDIPNNCGAFYDDIRFAPSWRSFGNFGQRAKSSSGHDGAYEGRPLHSGRMMRRSAPQLNLQPSSAGLIARLAYTLARRKAVDVEQLLQKAGLSRAQMEVPGTHIHVKSQIMFLNLVAEVIGDDLLGFHLSQHFDLRMIGLLYYVFASSKTLDDALRNGARCTSIVNESIRITINDKKRRIGFVFDSVGISRHSDRHQIEFWMATVVRACRLITKRHVIAESITSAHPRKETTELSRFFGSKLAFGADVDQVIFSPMIKDIATVSADTYLNDLLIGYCEEALVDQKRRGLFGIAVENAIAVLLPHGKGRISEVARKLGQSPRTLARRLACEGRTFSSILRELRVSLAHRHLADKDLTISQIAWLLGYQDVSAFTGAYKHWTGHSPRSARRHTR
jgi:AraC-like DNA-binding protein